MRMHCRGDISTHFSAPQFSEDIHPTDKTHYQVSLLVLLLPAAWAARLPGRLLGCPSLWPVVPTNYMNSVSTFGQIWT